jgi:hypothetical protein
LLNRYGYVANDPLNAVDPLGLDPCAFGDISEECITSSRAFIEWLLCRFGWCDAGPGGEDDRRRGGGGSDSGDKTKKSKPANNEQKCQTYLVPKNVQAAALAKLGWTPVSVTLTPDNQLAAIEIANLAFKSLTSGLYLPADSRMTISGTPGGFQISVSGGPTPGAGYLGLPTNSWYSAGINFAQFSNGQFTNVNGQVQGITGTSLAGSLFGINSQIQSSLNGNAQAVAGAGALSTIMGVCR